MDLEILENLTFFSIGRQRYLMVRAQILHLNLLGVKPFKRQPHKMVKHTQASRRLTADELFECI